MPAAWWLSRLRRISGSWLRAGARRRPPLLRPDPAQRSRLTQICANLADRIAEAEKARWHGEAEGLKVSLAGASHKLTQMDQITARRSATINLGMPDFTAAAGRAITTPATLTRTQTGIS